MSICIIENIWIVCIYMKLLILCSLKADIYSILNKLTNYMEQNFSWEANSLLDNQAIPSLLWNSNVHKCVHKSPPLVPILSQINPVHNVIIYFVSNLVSSSYVNPGNPNCLFSSCFF
jgi:hypothetical protein